jgi:hypothetical protein
MGFKGKIFGVPLKISGFQGGGVKWEAMSRTRGTAPTGAQAGELIMVLSGLCRSFLWCRIVAASEERMKDVSKGRNV